MNSTKTDNKQGQVKKKSMDLNEQIPWLNDITYKIINIGFRTLDTGNIEEQIMDVLKELTRLFQKEIMTKYRNSKKENRKTKLATYLQDTLAKIKLMSMLLTKEAEKGLSLYFGPLFKMFIELSAGSTLSKMLGRDRYVQTVLNMGKTWFRDDIETLLDVYITVIMPEDVQNSILLNVLSEKSYYLPSATCAIFYKYLVVAKILRERFSSDTSTINGINQLLSSSKGFIPDSFQSYLQSVTSIPNLQQNSVNLINIVRKIDSARAREESQLRFYTDDEGGKVEIDLDSLYGIPTAGENEYFVDKNPDTDLSHLQEVMEAAATFDESDNEELEIDSKDLYSRAISSDEEGADNNETEDIEEDGNGKECFENMEDNKPEDIEENVKECYENMEDNKPEDIEEKETGKECSGNVEDNKPATATASDGESSSGGPMEKNEDAAADSSDLEILDVTKSGPVNDYYDEEESVGSPESLKVPNYDYDTSPDDSEVE